MIAPPHEGGVEDGLGGAGRDALRIEAEDKGIVPPAAVGWLERPRGGGELRRAGMSGDDEVSGAIEADRVGHVFGWAPDRTSPVAASILQTYASLPPATSWEEKPAVFASGRKPVSASPTTSSPPLPSDTTSQMVSFPSPPRKVPQRRGPPSTGREHTAPIAPMAMRIRALPSDPMSPPIRLDDPCASARPRGHNRGHSTAAQAPLHSHPMLRTVRMCRRISVDMPGRQA